MSSRPRIIDLTLENLENNDDYTTLNNYITFLEGKCAQVLSNEYSICAKKASVGLLMSMATRYDHGIGLLDNDDKHLQYVLRVMSQLHEEVVGTGFYRGEQL